jgi:hypothetical protein
VPELKLSEKTIYKAFKKDLRSRKKTPERPGKEVQKDVLKRDLERTF